MKLVRNKHLPVFLKALEYYYYYNHKGEEDEEGVDRVVVKGYKFLSSANVKTVTLPLLLKGCSGSKQGAYGRGSRRGCQ